MHSFIFITMGILTRGSEKLKLSNVMHDLMNCVWLLDEVQLQQCTRNQAFLRYSVGDTVLGGVYSTRDRVKTANLLMLISLE